MIRFLAIGTLAISILYCFVLNSDALSENITSSQEIQSASVDSTVIHVDGRHATTANNTFMDHLGYLWIWSMISVALIIAGLLMYFYIWRSNKDALSCFSFRDKVMCLVSHVPDDESPAWPHVFAGVMASFGFCVFVGVVLACWPTSSLHYDETGTFLAASGFVFAILISVISFWTLWQTRKIERLYGESIEGFKGLTQKIAEEIAKLNDDFRKHGQKASKHHRIFIVTTNPYFGILSFHGDKEEQDFKLNLLGASDYVKKTSAQKDGEKYVLEVICGDSNQIIKFNEHFYKEHEPGTDSAAEIKRSNDATEHFIKSIEDNTGAGSIIRTSVIPEVQFAIIGNVVYEFILLPPRKESPTGIMGARRIADRAICSRFVNQFKVLQQYCTALKSTGK